jgi:transposase InsO family protein
MTRDERRRNRERWAGFRLSVVGRLLAAPPEPGTLRQHLEELAKKEWTHPTKGTPINFKFSTLEGWYYQAKAAHLNPAAALTRKIRVDAGTFKSLSPALKDAIVKLHLQYPRWTHWLHHANLVVMVDKTPALGPVPSYSTLRRFRKAKGLLRRRGPRNAKGPGLEAAAKRLEERETLGFEAEFVNGLWHTDFHHGSRKVLTANGTWATPFLIAIVDDHSRIICHAQWYLAETAENAIHALCQAIQKHGLPHLFMHDGGSPFVAGEMADGLPRLGITPEKTLAYSPNQNGKQENLWGLFEGRLVPLFDRCPEITLKDLNVATQAFYSLDYHERLHSELGTTPMKRYMEARSVARPSPTVDELRFAFTIEQTRRVRRSDGTVPLEGTRFQLPLRYRHHEEVVVRYARWDLSFVTLVDPVSGALLGRILPRDTAKNADGMRRMLPVEEASEGQQPAVSDGPAPLLVDLLERAKNSGLPPAYLPKDEEQ